MIYTSTISLLLQKCTVLFRKGIKIRGNLGDVNTCYEVLLRYNKITTLQLVHGSHWPGMLLA